MRYLRGIRRAAVVTAVALLQLLALRLVAGCWRWLARRLGRPEIRRRRLVGWATRDSKSQKEGDE